MKDTRCGRRNACGCATDSIVGGDLDTDAYSRKRCSACAEHADDAALSRREAINFYYDRFLLEADGNVRLRTSDGFTVTGDAFSMDLKLNRFMVAGHVTLHDAAAR